MSIQEYTCGFMIDAEGRFLLVEKTKPAWQAGKLNGIGGKVEPGEDPFACMRREWTEETGDAYEAWDHVCTLNFPQARVHFFRAIVAALPDVLEFNDAGERLVTVDANDLPASVIDNLRWLVPLCLDPNGTIGGKIIEEIAACPS